VAAATAATAAFNGLLAVALAPLPQALGITIVPFDGHAFFNDLVANPPAFGLENVTDACLTPDTPPFICRAPDRYLYWDGIHPTASACLGCSSGRSVTRDLTGPPDCDPPQHRRISFAGIIAND
jgi:phospholipase/lecithinase/hemolysin